MSDQSEDARTRWNRRFRQRGVQAFQRAPAAWLVEHRSLLLGCAGRRALDVACGDGRNAGYLAGLGFEVDAVDVSDVAIEALRAAAVQQALSVRPYRLDLEQSPLPAGGYDVIVQFNYLQRDLFGPLAQALRPGGLLILETFTRADGDACADGMNPRYELEHDELRLAFPALEHLHHSERVAGHGGASRRLAGLVARRQVTVM